MPHLQRVKVYSYFGSTYTFISGTIGQRGKFTITLSQGSFRFRAYYKGMQFWSGN